MSSVVLILEDNDDKIVNIFMKYAETLRGKEIFIARSVAQAQHYLAGDPGITTLFVDYELDPGCGNGIELLEWVMITFIHFIELIVVTTLNPGYSKQMCRLCTQHGVPFERF